MRDASLASRQPGRTLYLHIAPEALRPTVFTVAGLTLVVLTQDFMMLSELVINRGTSVGTVVRLALLEAIPIASQMLPFAALVGSLVQLGRMGADREILALESLGVSGSRLVWPFLAFSVVMTAVALPLSLFVAPWADRQLGATYEMLIQSAPWTQVRAGVSSAFGGWQLEAREVSGERGEDLTGVLLWMPRPGETVFAERGVLDANEDGAIELTLHTGSVVLSTSEGPRHLRFERMAATLPKADEQPKRYTTQRLEGLSLVDLAAAAAQFQPTPDNPLPVAALELHRRFSIPSATLVFGFMSAPLFFARRSFSRAGGSVLGLLCTAAYYGLVQIGNGLIVGGWLGAGAACWMPNVVMLALGLVLFFRARRVQVLGVAPQRGGGGRRWRSERAESAAEPGASRRLRPSRWPLPRYVAARYAGLVGLTFASLLTAYLAIDVMDRLSWFARYEASGSEALRFYATRVPLLASRVVPMALLVATALLVSLLAVEGELIGMRACGIPAPRAMIPALLITVLVSPGYLVFKNFLVPRFYEMGEELKQREIKAEYHAKRAARRRAPVWVRSGKRLLEAERFDEFSGNAREVTIYELDERGLPVRRTDARSARHIGNGVWRLLEPSRIEVSNGHLSEVPPRRFENLGAGLRAEVDTRRFTVAELAREIDELEEGGQDSRIFRVDFHVRFAEAASVILLPAVALFFAVSGPPFPGPAQNLLVSGVLGVGYILLTSVSASFGNRGTLPPVLGGWLPPIFFGSVAAFFFFRMLRRL